MLGERWSSITIGILSLALSADIGAADPPRVLILNPFGRDVEPFTATVSAFRSTLARELGQPVDIHEIPLDLARFTDPEGEGALVDFLENQIRDHPVDLVAPIGGSGAQFAARHRERLFPDNNPKSGPKGVEPRSGSCGAKRRRASRQASPLSARPATIGAN